MSQVATGLLDRQGVGAATAKKTPETSAGTVGT